MLSVLELQVLRRNLADRYAQLYRNSKLSPSERLTRLREVKQLLGAAGVSSAPFNADAPSIARIFSRPISGNAQAAECPTRFSRKWVPVLVTETSDALTSASPAYP